MFSQCRHTAKLIKLHIWNICCLFSVNYSLIKKLLKTGEKRLLIMASTSPSSSSPSTPHEATQWTPPLCRTRHTAPAQPAEYPSLHTPSLAWNAFPTEDASTLCLPPFSHSRNTSKSASKITSLRNLPRSQHPLKGKLSSLPFNFCAWGKTQVRTADGGRHLLLDLLRLASPLLIFFESRKYTNTKQKSVQRSL